ncbi:hypothetical protein BCR36DRAFT_585323 [Piromyces finnis]|uniref:Uncharacterized protein n=1 Tax=Piromyces finnis TaxID=1754191 RepID=A0A1Y1V304_9FUNG|nr:hypothetical protein BCR36DRAFT_585323 [Piromyces finnis]|eukprot:ORX46184.1 hypothetical protein BCR36DRAFT_585323 [Piromyces finnis]
MKLNYEELKTKIFQLKCSFQFVNVTLDLQWINLEPYQILQRLLNENKSLFCQNSEFKANVLETLVNLVDYVYNNFELLKILDSLNINELNRLVKLISILQDYIILINDQNQKMLVDDYINLENSTQNLKLVFRYKNDNIENVSNMLNICKSFLNSLNNLQEKIDLRWLMNNLLFYFYNNACKNVLNLKFYIEKCKDGLLKLLDNEIIIFNNINLELTNEIDFKGVVMEWKNTFEAINNKIINEEWLTLGIINFIRDHTQYKKVSNSTVKLVGQVRHFKNSTPNSYDNNDYIEGAAVKVMYKGKGKISYTLVNYLYQCIYLAKIKCMGAKNLSKLYENILGKNKCNDVKNLRELTDLIKENISFELVENKFELPTNNNCRYMYIFIFQMNENTKKNLHFSKPFTLICERRYNGSNKKNKSESFCNFPQHQEPDFTSFIYDIRPYIKYNESENYFFY